jgi:hypothetical protein
LLFHFFDVFMCHPSLRAIGSSLDQTARRVRHRCKKRNTSSQQSHQQLVELRLGTLLRPHNHPHAVVCTETAALFRLPTARRARRRSRKSNTPSQQSHQQLVELEPETLLRPHNHPHAVVCTETAALLPLPTARRAHHRSKEWSTSTQKSHQQLVELRLETLPHPHNHPHAVVCTATAALFLLPTARRARHRNRKRSTSTQQNHQQLVELRLETLHPPQRSGVHSNSCVLTSPGCPTRTPPEQGRETPRPRRETNSSLS